MCARVCVCVIPQANDKPVDYDPLLEGIQEGEEEVYFSDDAKEAEYK